MKTYGIKRFTDEEGEYFVSDNYPDSRFEFAEILMVERIQELAGCDFERAWDTLKDLPGVLSIEDLRIYIGAVGPSGLGKMAIANE